MLTMMQFPVEIDDELVAWVMRTLAYDQKKAVQFIRENANISVKVDLERTDLMKSPIYVARRASIQARNQMIEDAKTRRDAEAARKEAIRLERESRLELKSEAAKIKAEAALAKIENKKAAAQRRAKDREQREAAEELGKSMDRLKS